MQNSKKNTDQLLTSHSGCLGAYKAPRIEMIVLDNEISLQLESNPPLGPGEGTSLSPMYLKNDLFKNSMA